MKKCGAPRPLHTYPNAGQMMMGGMAPGMGGMGMAQGMGGMGMDQGLLGGFPMAQGMAPGMGLMMGAGHKPAASKPAFGQQPNWTCECGV